MSDPNGRQRTGRHIIPGMPSNNLYLVIFIRFLLNAGADERLSPDKLIAEINKTGPKLGPIDEFIYGWYIIPTLREGLLERRTRLFPLLGQQPPWGPGRVDTFNPYKLIQANIPLASLQQSELIGIADFPSIFNQGPREGMHLHWDGDNTSLAERNLSAAIGAGVTPDSVDFDVIDRVARWLKTLQPPPSPHQPDATAVARGRDIFMSQCSACHGYADSGGYRFTGSAIGQVEPNDKLGADPHRLDSIPKNSANTSWRISSSVRPISSSISSRRMATPIYRWTACGCVRPICITVQSRHSRLCCRRRASALLPLSAELIGSTRRTAASKRPLVILRRHPQTRSASIPACQATAIPAIHTAPTCRRRRRPTSLPIC